MPGSGMGLCLTEMNIVNMKHVSSNVSILAYNLPIPILVLSYGCFFTNVKWIDLSPVMTLRECANNSDSMVMGPKGSRMSHGW